MASKKTSVKDLRPTKDAFGGGKKGNKKKSVSSSQGRGNKSFDNGNPRKGQHLL